LETDCADPIIFRLYRLAMNVYVRLKLVADGNLFNFVDELFRSMKFSVPRDNISSLKTLYSSSGKSDSYKF